MVVIVRFPVSHPIENVAVIGLAYSMLERKRIASKSPDCTYHVELVQLAFMKSVPVLRLRSVGLVNQSTAKVLEV